MLENGPCRKRPNISVETPCNSMNKNIIKANRQRNTFWLGVSDNFSRNRTFTEKTGLHIHNLTAYMSTAIPPPYTVGNSEGYALSRSVGPDLAELAGVCYGFARV